MSFDPTTETVHCAGCGRSSGDSQADERWYRMGWQTHCPGCARTYAAEEAYLLDEEVGT
jgi:hypothetical protein